MTEKKQRVEAAVPPLDMLSMSMRRLLLSFNGHVQEARSRSINKLAKTVSEVSILGERKTQTDQARQSEALLVRFLDLLEPEDIYDVLRDGAQKTLRDRLIFKEGVLDHTDANPARLRAAMLQREEEWPGAISYYLGFQAHALARAKLYALLKPELVHVLYHSGAYVAAVGKETKATLGARSPDELRDLIIEHELRSVEDNIAFLEEWLPKIRAKAAANAEKRRQAGAKVSATAAAKRGVPAADLGKHAIRAAQRRASWTEKEQEEADTIDASFRLLVVGLEFTMMRDCYVDYNRWGKGPPTAVRVTGRAAADKCPSVTVELVEDTAGIAAGSRFLLTPLGGHWWGTIAGKQMQITSDSVLSSGFGSGSGAGSGSGSSIGVVGSGSSVGDSGSAGAAGSR